MSSPDIPPPARIQTSQRQIAYALNLNAIEFVDHYGIDHCAFLTLTFKERLYPIPAKKKLRKALTILSNYFHDWIWVMGLTKNLRIHYHALVAGDDNLRDGIDLTAYQRLLDIKDDGLPSLSNLTPAEQRAQVRQILSSNAALLQLRRDLYPRLHKLGFGLQLDLSPVYSDAKAIADYLKENYLDTVRRKDLLFRGVRLAGYRRGGHRICRPPFAWANQRQRRLARRIVADALGVTDYHAMSPTFGPKWGYLTNLMILDLESHHGPNPLRWPVANIRAMAEEAMPKITPS